MSEAGGMHPREQFSSYLDDELSIDAREAVDRHLALCASCRSELASLRALAAALRDEDVPDVPDDLAVRVAMAIDAATVVPFARPKRNRFVLPATIAATIGAVGLLAVLQWRGGTGVPTVAPTALPPPPPLAKVAEQTPPEDKKKADAPRPSVDAALPRVTVPEFKDEAPKEREAGTMLGEREERDRRVDELAAARKQSAEEGFARDAATPEQAPAAPPAAVPSAGALNREFRTSVSGISSASACGDRWVDTGVLASWAVADTGAARERLAALAGDLGGRSEGVEPYPEQLALFIPQARVTRMTAALKAMGVTGLDAPMKPEEAFDCVRQRITLLSSPR